MTISFVGSEAQNAAMADSTSSKCCAPPTRRRARSGRITRSLQVIRFGSMIEMTAGDWRVNNKDDWR